MQKHSNVRCARTYIYYIKNYDIDSMNENDTRKLQLLLCAALIDERDTQRRVLEKINYVINKNHERTSK
jgi:hypothetical protein